MWTVVDFGKWRGKGKTLPQIIVSDPDWFFWALEQDAFKGGLALEAKKLGRRAKSIRLPPALAGTHCVQYVVTHDGKFGGFNVIASSQPAHVGSSGEVRRPHLNLAAPREFKGYDKLGCRLMLKSFKYYWFNNKAFTKTKVEDFFEDSANFLKP
jgi:hypothetical protein